MYSYDNIIEWLFKTNAIRICPQDKPFWYTSGTIGPYYINTHFLYGNEVEANHLLKIIDVEKANILTCPLKVLSAVKANYKKSEIYKGLIDEMINYIKSNINLEEVDYISGGERRDWFFSIIIADLLGKPHITIYKNLATVKTENKQTEEIENFSGKRFLHIADLITEASSYERAWIPAIKRRGGDLKWSVVVVDRKQGGNELLSVHGANLYSMIDIDIKLFEKVLSLGLINKKQYDMIINYIKNPKESMKEFLLKNPNFLRTSLESDAKTKERAALCLEKNIYELP